MNYEKDVWAKREILERYKETQALVLINLKLAKLLIL